MGWISKEGGAPSFTSGSYLDHISPAVKQDCPLSAPIPLPPDVVASIDWIATTDPKQILAFWREQRASLSRLVAEEAPTQAAWVDSIPPELRGAQSHFFSVAFRQLLHHFGLGGDRWISQFIFGLPTVCSFSHGGFPHFRTNTPPRPPWQLFGALLCNVLRTGIGLPATGSPKNFGANQRGRFSQVGPSNPPLLG